MVLRQDQCTFFLLKIALHILRILSDNARLLNHADLLFVISWSDMIRTMKKKPFISFEWFNKNRLFIHKLCIVYEKLNDNPKKPTKQLSIKVIIDHLN